MSRSQNGWPVLQPGSAYLYTWTVPADTGSFVLPLRRGAAGMVLCHYAMWHAEVVETVAGKGDDFGYALRSIPGTDVYSNHASGTAIDLNASEHPSGISTFSDEEITQIHNRLSAWQYKGVLGWGGDYIHAPVDQMHFEISADQTTTRALAVRLKDTARGRQILAANPTQSRFLS